MGATHVWRYNHVSLILFFCLTLPSFTMLQQLPAEKEATFVDGLHPLKNDL